ncbi:MAG TPA: VOC family protein [Lacipirellulaceae bacterium]|jgi:catechol 2,3-dioxygenase-like lactoylglutathione lyase family enzyme
MVRHLAGVAEIVDDVAAAVAFYCDTLGFEVKQRMGEDYVVFAVPGILHFGVWSRAAAAEATFGDRAAVDSIPLGYTLEFEVDDLDQTASQIGQSQCVVVQEPHTEPWGQKTCRAIAPGGGLLGFAVTPWARRIAQQVQASPGDT